MLNFILAQAAASNDGGKAILGFLMILGACWFVAYLCRPRGWDINHKGQTTIKPRR